MFRLPKVVAPIALLAVLMTTASANDLNLDWSYWRGPEMNGISREKDLVDSWDPRGETLLWQKPELASRSTPIVMRGKLYTLARDNPGTELEGEKVICADAATGDVLWENRFNVYLSDVPDTRVGWSSVVGDPETGHVFALGVCCHFLCIDGETGKTIWSRSLSEEYGMLNTYGGRTNFPVVHGDLVIVSGVIIGWGDMAKPAHRFIAFDKRNGQPVWFNGTRLLPDDTTYSAPVLAVVEGQAQMIFGSGDGGIHAFQPRTGKRVWTYNVSDRGINTTPVVAGHLVICGHSEENTGSTKMGALFALDATKSGDITGSGEVWRNLEMFIGKSSPVVVGDRVYAVEDKGKLLVVDLKTGQQIGRSIPLGTQGRASPLYADGKLYVCEANGRMFIFRPDEEQGVEVVERARLSGAEIHGSPIASHGRIYLPTTSALYCFGKADQTPSADPPPSRPAEAPVADDAQPAWVQVVPVEALLRSGEKRQRQQFDVRLYNARGQWLSTADASDVEFSIDGLGSIDEQGRFTTPQEPVHGAAVVTAKVGDLTGQARIRVVPDLPWSFDFSDGEVPISWVGMRYRHIALDFDLLEKLKQQNPLASQLYILLLTDFINGGQSKLTYDNSTPRELWTNFLRFFKQETEITTLEAAQEKFDPALELLKQEQVLAGWEWAKTESNDVRFVVERGPRQVDGNGVMCKIITIPKGARSQGWMGPEFSNYTIQADVYGAVKDDKLPDIGVQAQRYRLSMMGAKQELELKSWIAHEIKYQTAPFAWEPETWYTIKLTASTVERDGRNVALLQGKVWPRDAEEPADWQIEWTDSPPDEVGSPGLFGNAKDAEIFFDNVKVTKN